MIIFSTSVGFEIEALFKIIYITAIGLSIEAL